MEETFVRGGSFRSWNGLHLEVVSFPCPEIFKKEVMKFDKTELDTPTICFYDSVSDLSFLDVSISAGAHISNKYCRSSLG